MSATSCGGFDDQLACLQKPQRIDLTCISKRNTKMVNECCLNRFMPEF